MGVRTSVVGVALVLLLAAACGDGGAPESSGRGPGVSTYRLTDGSEIRFVDPTGSGSEVVTEALRGTFDLAPTTQIPHSSFDYAIVRIDFQSQSFSVVGTEGSLRSTLLSPLVPVTITAAVKINGQPVDLLGFGSRSTYEGGATLRWTGLEAAGGGYTIRIFADPEE